MLRNLIAAKFKTILNPIAATLMKKKQLPLLSQVFTLFLKATESPCFHNVCKHLNTSPYVLQCFLVTYTSTLSQEAFFNNVLFHELSHSLGPAFVGNDEANGEVVSRGGTRLPSECDYLQKNSSLWRLSIHQNSYSLKTLG